LNSSLAQSAAKLWLVKFCPERANHTFFVTFSVLTKIRFLSHDFGSRYARKLLKGSNNVDLGLVSKKTGDKKMVLVGLVPRVRYAGPKKQKHAPTQRTPNPKQMLNLH